MPSRSMALSRTRSRKRARSASRSTSRRSAGRSRYRARSRVRVRGTHAFSRHCAALEVSLNGLFISRMYTVSFQDMIQATDFTSLFDAYRIAKVTFKFQLITNPDANLVTNSGAGNVPNPTNWFPKMWYISDYDGGSTETLNSIRERQGVKCRVLKPDREIKVTITPKCRVLTYKTDTTEGFAPRSIRIDMSSPDVPHYGLAVVFDTNGIDPNDTYPFRINVERKITFQCYGVR